MSEHEHDVKSAEEAVKEAEAHLTEARRKAAHREYPKWIEPHASHLDHTNGHISVPLFPEHHVDRDGKVTVLVKDADDEARALAQRAEKALTERVAEDL